MLRLAVVLALAGAVALSVRAAWGEVLLKEDFEEPLTIVPWMKEGGWFGSKLGDGKEITAETAASGSRCLKITTPKGTKGPLGFFHKVKPTEVIYVRYYRMFEKDWQWWAEGYGPHDTEIYGGEFRNPTTKDIGIYTDFWRTGDVIARVATPLQRGAPKWGRWLRARYGKLPPGNGLPWNVAPPEKIVPGRWFWVETMAKMSTPGREDGVVKLWVNGKLVTDCRDLPLRDAEHPDIKFDLWFLGPYNHPGVPRTQSSYIDAIVISTEPIGPLSEEEKSEFLKRQERELQKER